MSPLPCLQAGCQAVADLAAQVPRSQLTQHHEALICALDANLSHQHSRIRLAGLSALQPLVFKVCFLIILRIVSATVACVTQRKDFCTSCVVQLHGVQLWAHCNGIIVTTMLEQGHARIHAHEQYSSACSCGHIVTDAYIFQLSML